MRFESSVIPLQAIHDAITKKYDIRLFVLRADLNHPEISGNKLFKLKYNIAEAEKQGKKTILTYGGAFSNHIAATAAAGKEYGFATIGIIRGEEHAPLSPTLQFALDCGMELHYVSRSLYRNKEELNSYVDQNFSERIFYLIPEGGSNEFGVLGCKEITNYIPIDYDYVCCACGTGTTLSGVILSLKGNQQAIGFQVLKAENYIHTEVEKWLHIFNHQSADSWHIEEGYHFGKYAKINQELTDFIYGFEQTHNIPLDYIYTGKMIFGIYDLIQKGFFKKGQTIVAIHTGGLQGNAGFLSVS